MSERLTRDERKMLSEIGGGDELRIHVRSPTLRALRKKRFAYTWEDGDYEMHVGITDAGRSALHKGETS